MQPLHQFSEERDRSLRVWYDFLERTRKTVKALPMDWIPGESQQMAIFFYFARDRHPYAEYSIRNVMFHLGPQWGLQIFNNPASRPFVQTITTDWSHVHTTTIDIRLPDDTRDVPDILKRSPDFWRLVKGEFLFLFDLDTILRKELNPDQFLHYDYVAPLWHPDETPGFEQAVGCGHISLRRKSAMLEISESVSPDPETYPREDMFYALNLAKRAPSRVAPTDVAQAFASQNDVGVDPVALRRPWIGNPASNLERLLSTIRY